MFIRSFSLLLVVTTTRIVPFLCSEIDITNIGTNICDVEKNKRSYDTFKTGRPKCLNTFEEKLDFYRATVSDKNLFAYITTLATEHFEEQVNRVRSQAPLVEDSGQEGFYKVTLVNRKVSF
jgi:hypothetical protein